jgi:hypothetical protein
MIAHRPFISIDAEGRKFPGFDEIDAAGNIWPLHRTVLWGAGGWQRNNSSSDLMVIGLVAATRPLIGSAMMTKAR